MSTRVLVVDDEPFIVTGLRTFLEDEGMQVESAASGEEALEFIHNDCGIDVCIMDMRLPGMNGDTAIRFLHEICPDLKFIIHTGTADYSIPDDLRAMGIDECQLFAKPLQDMTPLAQAVAVLADAGDE
jgi:CheY-like chemotaxis protein